MTTITGLLAAHPTVPLVLVSHNAWDYEPLFSNEHYVRSAGDQNKMAILLEGYSSNSLNEAMPDSKLPIDLARQLETLESQGGKGFEPSKAIDLSGDCLSLGFSGPPLNVCTQKIQIW